MAARFRSSASVIRLAVATAAAVFLVAGAATEAAAATRRFATSRWATPTAPRQGSCRPDPTAPPQCLRSILNYPHVIAGETARKLTDVTCGAAETGDFFSSQYGGVPPQLDALTKDTRLVTMTIGGNDSDVFINTIVNCGRAGLATAGQGSPCKDRYGSSFEDTIRDEDLPLAGEGARGGPRQGAAGAGRHPRLPLDHAGDRGLLRQDARRRG